MFFMGYTVIYGQSVKKHKFNSKEIQSAKKTQANFYQSQKDLVKQLLTTSSELNFKTKEKKNIARLNLSEDAVVDFKKITTVTKRVRTTQKAKKEAFSMKENSNVRILTQDKRTSPKIKTKEQVGKRERLEK